MALALIAMFLPLRRKLAARMPGSGNLWRLIHGLVGVVLLAGVLVHSSGRVGQGLNGALSVATLAFTMAGAALALGWRRAPPSRRRCAACCGPSTCCCCGQRSA